MTNMYIRPKIICFDFDGTVADSMPLLENNAVTIICKYFQLRKKEAQKAYHLSTGLPFTEQINITFPDSPRTLRQKAIKEFEDQKGAVLLVSPLFPDTLKVLKSVKKMGFGIAISSSSKYGEIKSFMKRNGLSSYVDWVLGFKRGFSKGKDHFDYLLKMGDCQRKHIWYIGDSLNDMHRCHQEKIYFIGKTGPMFSKSDFVLDNGETKTRFRTIRSLSGLLPKLIMIVK
jgi:phosphoglycolate phosphatase-like HAD superfamily hydrolase